jgi:hypothetical protein
MSRRRIERRPSTGSMTRFCEFCTKVRVVGAEVASTVVFLVFLYVATRYEITHLLSR